MSEKPTKERTIDLAPKQPENIDKQLVKMAMSSYEGSLPHLATSTHIQNGVMFALEEIQKTNISSAEFGTGPEYHNIHHTLGVMDRYADIIDTIRSTDTHTDTVPSSIRDMGILIAAFHDINQDYEEIDGMRKRKAGNIEEYSIHMLEAYMNMENKKHQEFIYTKDDFAQIRDIRGTVPGFSSENNVHQPNITESSSITKVALALADLGEAGMSDSQVFLSGAKALFREDNMAFSRLVEQGLDFTDVERTEGIKKMKEWLDFQTGFINARMENTEREISYLPEHAQDAVRSLFINFEGALLAVEEEKNKITEMSLEEMLAVFEYPRFDPKALEIPKFR